MEFFNFGSTRTRSSALAASCVCISLLMNYKMGRKSKKVYPEDGDEGCDKRAKNNMRQSRKKNAWTFAAHNIKKCEPADWQDLPNAKTRGCRGESRLKNDRRISDFSPCVFGSKWARATVFGCGFPGSFVKVRWKREIMLNDIHCLWCRSLSGSKSQVEARQRMSAEGLGAKWATSRWRQEKATQKRAHTEDHLVR